MLIIKELIEAEDDIFDKVKHTVDRNRNILPQVIQLHNTIRDIVMLDISDWKTTSFIVINNQGNFEHLKTTKSIPLNGLISAIWREVKNHGVKAFDNLGQSSDYDKKSKIMKYFNTEYNLITDAKENGSLPNKSFNEERYQRCVYEDDRIRIYDENGLLDYKVIEKLCNRIALYFWNEGYTILNVVNRKSIFLLCHTKQEYETIIKKQITEEQYFESLLKVNKVFKILKEETLQ